MLLVKVQISTREYKISPLKKAARELLGYPHPRRVPRGVYVEQAIGISTDEFTRAKDPGVAYLRNIFPLIELGWDRAACVTYLTERGFGHTVKSACIGCPFHGNAGWRWIRDHDPDGWRDAVEFDKAIRHGYPHAIEQGQRLRGQYFLHRSCQPLDKVDLDPPAPAKRHLRLVDADSAEEPDPDGCSPWSCRRHAGHWAACGMTTTSPHALTEPRPHHDHSAGTVTMAGLVVAAAYVDTAFTANRASAPWPAPPPRTTRCRAHRQTHRRRD